MDQTLAKAYKVTSMPTFQFYKSNKKIDEFEGGNEAKLTTLLTSFSSPISNSLTVPVRLPQKVRARLIQQATKRTLHIIHFNDVYNFDPEYEEEPIGGASRFTTFLDALKHKLDKSYQCKPLLLFSGDFVGPSLMSSVTKGAHMIELFNLLGVHYATFGNHEVDYGYESLKSRLAGRDDDVEDAAFGTYDYPETHTQWVMSNMTEKSTGDPLGGKGVVKTALFDWDGSSAKGKLPIRVGILAVSENWLDGCGNINPADFEYEDYIESARAAARSLKSRGAEVVLALTHSRLNKDYELTKAVPEIDVLLGGHDHFYKEDLPFRIVKSGEEWRWASEVTVSVEAGKHPELALKTHEVTSTIALSKEVQDLCEKYKTLCERKFGRVIFQTAVDMDPTEESVRFKECALANWVCDMCAWDFNAEDGVELGADICILQGFIFSGKAVIPKGDFTLGHLMSVFPKSISIVVVKLSGADVVRSLEHGAQNLPGECGALHHVSSRLKYTIDLGAAGEKAKPKVKNVLFDGEPIDLTRIFTVAITDSLAKGGYGFTWFKTAETIVQEEFASQLQDLCLQYCKAKSADPSLYPANPTLGRISISRGTSLASIDSFVKELHSKTDLDSLLKSSGDKLVVIHFTVDWCAPCRVITPAFNASAADFQDAVFVRVSMISFFCTCV